MADLNIKSIVKPRTSGRWGTFEVETDWQTAQTDSMMSRTMTAVGPANLMLFLEEMADPYLTEEIIDRFAYEGDDKSGDWAPLTETTRRIREDLGLDGQGPINERTGEFVAFMVHSREAFPVGDYGAVLSKPGDPDSDALEAKLRHAQEGSKDNRLFPGAETPPRPVLATDEEDLGALLKLLEIHVMQTIATGL